MYTVCLFLITLGSLSWHLHREQSRVPCVGATPGDKPHYITSGRNSNIQQIYKCEKQILSQLKIALICQHSVATFSDMYFKTARGAYATVVSFTLCFPIVVSAFRHLLYNTNRHVKMSLLLNTAHLHYIDVLPLHGAGTQKRGRQLNN